MWTLASDHLTNLPSSQISSPVTPLAALFPISDTASRRFVGDPMRAGARTEPAALALEEPLQYALVFFATHVHDPQLAHRLDTLRLDLDGPREHLAGGARLAHRLVQPTQHEIGLLPVLCQPDPLTAMLERLLQDHVVVGVAEVEAPAVVGAILALAREMLDRPSEAEQRALVVPGCHPGLAPLELGLRLQRPPPLVTNLRDTMPQGD